MKRNIFKLLLGVSLVTTASCDDFIDIDPRGTQTIDNYFQTETECRSFINGIYRSFALYSDWWPQYMFVGNNMATDDAWMGNLSQDPGDAYPFAHYTIEAANSPSKLTEQYQYDYVTIGSCNTAIARIPNAPIGEAAKQRFVAEAKFFRAFTYWELIQNFGDVVLITQPEGTSSLNKQRSPKADVYAQVVKDLKEASYALPVSYSGDNIGRVTKYACHALLSRTYLYMKDYANAYAHADTVIRFGPYQLEPDFINIWSVNNHNGVESIFEVQANGDQTYNVGNMVSIMMGARGEIWPDNQSDRIMDGWGWCVPSSNLEQEYISEGDDIRRKSTIIRHGEAVYGDEELNPAYNFNVDINKSGRVWRKFYVPIATRLQLTKKDGRIPLPLVMLRLGEIYLNRAEAAYFLNNINQAHADLATLRARVKLGDKNNLTGNDLLYGIWKERRMELASEGQRLFDLRRQIDPVSNKQMISMVMGPNGSFVKYNLEQSTDPYETIHPKESQDKGKNFVEGKHELWPIPQSEIDRSNGLLTQNPGY